MNTKGIFSHASEHWRTPAPLRSELYREFCLNYDPCPLLSETDHLVHNWRGKRVFCNPPYSRIRDFVAKWHEPQIAVYLLPSRTGTAWFHETVLPFAKEVRFLRGRLRFGGSNVNAPFDSLIAVFEHVPKYY